MLGCNGGVLDDYYYKARIFITNRLQNYFAMINRNHNRDRTNANAILSKEQVGWNHVKQLFLNP